MKKVFIGVLAALMLFAFVACDNSSSSGLDQVVVSISVSGTPTYFAGETADIEDYTVTATTLGGSTFTVDPLYLSWAEAKTAPVAVAGDEDGEKVLVGGIQYNGVSYQDSPVAPAYATVYTLDSIVVEGPANSEYYGEVEIVSSNGTPAADKAQFKTSDYTVTGYAADEAYSRVLSYADGEWTVKFGDASTATNKVVEFTAAYKDADGSAVVNDATDNKIAATIYPDYVTNFTLALKPKAEVIVGTEAKDQTAKNYVDVTVEYRSGVVASTADTASNKVSIDDLGLKFEWIDTTLDEGKFKENTEAKIKASGTIGVNADSVTREIGITPKANYLEAFYVKYEGTVETGRSILSEDIKLDSLKGDNGSGLEWASGAAPTDFDASTLTFLINGEESFTVPKYLGDSESYPVTITIKGDEYKNLSFTLVLTTPASE